MKDFKCMLAKPLVEKRVVFPCLVSPKLDGIRAIYHKGEFYTRNKNVIRGVGHLKQTLYNFNLSDVSLDGELIIPGIPFQTSSGLIRSFNDTPEAVFYVFDTPSLEDIQVNRIRFIQEKLGLLTPASKIEIVNHIMVGSMDEVSDWYTTFRRAGFEGAMVKSLSGLYTNTRSATWQKIKATITHDCTCIGFFEGQGRLTNTLGGIIVDFNEIPVRVGGGFTDAERNEIWANQDLYIDQLCEVEAQEVTPDGSMRHPRFITWRWDK